MDNRKTTVCGWRGGTGKGVLIKFYSRAKASFNKPSSGAICASRCQSDAIGNSFSPVNYLAKHHTSILFSCSIYFLFISSLFCLYYIVSLYYILFQYCFCNSILMIVIYHLWHRLFLASVPRRVLSCASVVSYLPFVVSLFYRIFPFFWFEKTVPRAFSISCASPFICSSEHEVLKVSYCDR